MPSGLLSPANCNLLTDLFIALPISLGSAKNVPFANANEAALKKFLKCVGMDKTVLAYCDPAFGVNNKLRHPQEKVLPRGPPLSPRIKSCILLTLPNASAISLVV